MDARWLTCEGLGLGTLLHPAGFRPARSSTVTPTPLAPVSRAPDGKRRSR